MTIERGVRLGSLLVLALAGCVTTYSPPTPDAPQAELTITSNLEEPATDYSRIDNIFYAFGDADCQQPLGALAKFVKLFSQAPEVVQVAAGKRIYIRAASTIITRSGQLETSSYCYNLVSFVPQAGHDYLMHQDAGLEATGFGARAACKTTLSSIGEPPVASFAEHEFRGECARLIGR